MPTKFIQQNYTVSRYEQSGMQLFIRLESTNNPVYLEHYFTADEQLDIPTVMIDLVAQLQIIDDNYLAPTITGSVTSVSGNILTYTGGIIASFAPVAVVNKGFFTP
jgi:hypothetical protein